MRSAISNVDASSVASTVMSTRGRFSSVHGAPLSSPPHGARAVCAVFGFSLETLRTLKEDMCMQVLDKFCEANMSRITNKSGFLMGIVRRIETEPPGSGPTTADLPRGIRRRLDDLVDDRRIRASLPPRRDARTHPLLPPHLAHRALSAFQDRTLLPRPLPPYHAKRRVRRGESTRQRSFP